MTEAVTVRRDGDTYQARIFWARAARLLVPESHVVKVAFETGPKSFDDVWVDYAAGAGLLDQYGRPLLREHIQCKWHVSPDQYGYAELVDPAFINANARSLLQRAHEAQKNAGGAGIRFKLLTNWVVTRKDPLQRLIGEKSGALRHKRLFDEGGERSGVGQLRKLWRDHLALDDDGLRLLADSLAFGRTSDSLDGLRDYLDLIFLAAGIRRFSLSESVFPYDDLIFQWMSQGRQEFDRALLFDGLKRERLLANSVPPTMCYGVKSFEHAFDALHLRCSEVLDLTPEFDERFIIEQDDWSQVIYPRLLGFLRRAASASQQRLRLSLDAHSRVVRLSGTGKCRKGHYFLSKVPFGIRLA